MKRMWTSSDTVLLLDPRWPTMLPFELVAQITGEIHFTDEVPITVRWNFGDIVSPGHARWLVSTQQFHEEVQKALTSGAALIEVPSRADAVGQAVATMQRALQLGEWERTQTHASLIPYMEEEATELIEAIIDGASDEHLCSELGDVLLQILFHAEIAARRGSFDFSDVALSFVNKMKKRSPYLFDGTDEMVEIERQELLWQQGKHS